jgi:hypothetical protein
LEHSSLLITVDEFAKRSWFTREYWATFHVDLFAQPPLPSVMDALAEKLLAWIGKRGKHGSRILLTFRGVDGNLPQVQAELRAMMDRNPELKRRFGSLKELSGSFMDKALQQIDSFSFGN